MEQKVDSLMQTFFSVVKKNVTWNSKNSMIYIDNPVGTGFSFTDDDRGYATNEVDVGRDLYRYDIEIKYFSLVNFPLSFYAILAMNFLCFFASYL